MKIVYLHQYFNTPSMKGGTRSYEMARRLVSAGHEVHMVTARRSDEESFSGWRAETIDGIQVHWYWVPYSNKISFAKRVLAFIKFAWASRRKAASFDADVVFATSTPLTIAIPGVYAARKLRVPLVFEVRDLWPELPIAIGALRNPLLRWAAHRLEKYAYSNSARIIALSPGMKEGVVRTNYPEKRVVVIPNNCHFAKEVLPSDIPASFYERHPFYRDKKIVLYAGTLGKINGVGYLVDVAAAMRDVDPGIGFLIVGDGFESDLVAQRAEEREVLGENLWLTGRVPKNDIPLYFGAATLGCSLFIDLPEMWNNSANKFFDTLSSRRPIVINYDGWQAELLRETKAGIVVPPGNPMEAARLIHEFANDAEALSVAKQAADKLARDNFNIDKLFIQFEQTLKSAVAEGGSGAQG